MRVPLGVEHKPALVHPSVEVNGELWDTSDRPGCGEHGAAVGEGETPSDAKLPVEPGVQEWPAVDLDLEALPALRRRLRRRLELEPWRVGVRADDRERSGGGCRLRYAPGDDRPVAHHDVAPGLLWPFVPLIERSEAGVLEAACDLGRRVERRG